MHTLEPILYSFRRCPYAMRARMAIQYARQRVQLREVVLKEKPPELLAVSPKGTVPVLVLPTGQVIDESLDIMLWSLEQNDTENLRDTLQDCLALIKINDHEFKPFLDRYKYADRFSENSENHYRQACVFYLELLDDRLRQHRFLMGENLALSDLAIFPFIRQFANVDRLWFANSPFQALNAWLQAFLDSEHFKNIMGKYPQWVSGQAIEWF